MKTKLLSLLSDVTMLTVNNVMDTWYQNMDNCGKYLNLSGIVFDGVVEDIFNKL